MFKNLKLLLTVYKELQRALTHFKGHFHIVYRDTYVSLLVLAHRLKTYVSKTGYRWSNASHKHAILIACVYVVVPFYP